MARRSAEIHAFRRPFRAVPLARVNRPRRAWPSSRISPIMAMLPLAAFTAVLLWDGGPPGLAMALDFAGASPAEPDRERARFSRCGDGPRVNCVIDGDTFWYGGEKIRLADINTPEAGTPQCAAEAALAERATTRLQALLNAGAFTLEAVDRETDKYGRALRVASRDGDSLGQALVAEGLAERWRGYRGGWC